MSAAYRKWGGWLAVALLLILAIGAGVRLGWVPGMGVDAAGAAASQESAAPEVAAGELPGPGFAVWESNRSGRWRLWIRQLDGTGLRQLTPEEGQRAHCCPHVRPDGTAIAYLSLDPGPEKYPQGPERGVLRLIAPDGTGDRELAPAARTYGEHRAAVWHGPEELVFIDGDGYTVRLRLPSGDEERLTRDPHEVRGWLLNSRLTHATFGVPTFSHYHAATRTVTELQAFGGCQPYFSPDGRWGYWVAGAGGPLDKIDLESRVVSELVAKNDPRIPGPQGYLYFPMLSPDGRLLAWAGSADEHHHFRANYDVYAAETDPERLEVVATPVRLTSHPATDRFPAVFLAPQPLGIHTGEAPLTLTLTAPDRGDWQWELGDGTTRTAPEVEHRWEKAGTYRLTARRGEEELTGRVRVRPAAPPQLVATELRDGRRVVLRFDEPLAGRVEIGLDSGLAVASHRIAGKQLVVELAGALAGTDTLRLSGLTDRAQRPNPLPPLAVELAADRWPSNRDRLVFLWEHNEAENLVRDPGAGIERSFPLTRHGQVRLDHAYRMDLGDGTFAASEEASELLHRAIRERNELTLEATVTPGHDRQRAAIVAFSAGRKERRNLVLAQDGDELVLTLLTAGWGPVENRLPLGRLPAGEPMHVLVSYRPGRLVATLNGRPVVDTSDVQGDFFHWQPRPLLFGGERRAEATWSGLVEGVAIYARFLAPEEARENARRYLALADRRPRVPGLRLRGRLVARSDLPTREEITPYREALAVYEYEVEEVLAGEYSESRIRVAHWVILDDQPAPAAGWREGRSDELRLEPYADNPQLEPFFLSMTLETVPSPGLWYAVRH